MFSRAVGKVDINIYFPAVKSYVCQLGTLSKADKIDL